MSMVLGNTEYFPGSGKIGFEGRDSDNPRYINGAATNPDSAFHPSGGEVVATP